MSWRLAPSLETFRDQLNSRWPKRKRPDGTIGDTSHQARKSDHNEDEFGFVRAIDISHDPSVGLNCGVLAEALRASKDPRISYIIWNRKISNPDIDGGAWRNYTGSNPHDKHMHLSVKKARTHSTARWEAVDNMQQGEIPAGIPAPPLPMLRFGMYGDAVGLLQKIMGVKVTEKFDKTTEDAVKSFQLNQKIVSDGIVGPYTWGQIVGKAAP